MLLNWAPAVLRNAGLHVVETSGWLSRSHGEFPATISGVWHHDASPPGDSQGALNWMISNWNRASANFWVDRYGKWYCVGVGRAHHAGTVLPGMPNSATSFGVETDQTINETPSPALLDATRRGFAAMLSHMGRSANSLHFHKTIASPAGRKVDPWLGPTSGNMLNWPGELNTERHRVQELINSGVPKPPLPETGPIPLPVPDSVRKKDDQVPIFMQSTDAEGGRLYLLTPGQPKRWLNGQDWGLWARLYPEWADLPGSPFHEAEIDMVNAQYQPGGSNA